MSNTTTRINLGIPLFASGVIFITLKLTGVVDWSWWIVTIPFWIAPLIGVLVSFLVCGYSMIAAVAIFDAIKNNRLKIILRKKVDNQKK